MYFKLLFSTSLKEELFWKETKLKEMPIKMHFDCIFHNNLPCHCPK